MKHYNLLHSSEAANPSAKPSVLCPQNYFPSVNLLLITTCFSSKNVEIQESLSYKNPHKQIKCKPNTRMLSASYPSSSAFYLAVFIYNITGIS